MSTVVLKKGWCPTLLNPMQSGDGWLVRVKPHAARLSAGQAGVLAGLAARHGNGQIDLTSRGNLQVRGLTPDSAARFAEAAIAAGLALRDAGAERLRNVLASPLGPDDQRAEFDSHAVAIELEALLAQPAFCALPDKFGILVDAGGTFPLDDINADIVLRTCRGRLALSLASGRLAVLCRLANLGEIIGKLLRAIIDLSGGEPARAAELMKRRGELAVFQAAGLAVSQCPRSSTAQNPAAKSIGFTALAGGKGAFGAGLPFGRIDAATLASLAGLAARFGDGTLRTTPWRALLLVGVAEDEAPVLAKAVAGLGLITKPGDPRRFIAACVGKLACASAETEARADALRLAQSGPPPGLDIHVSACAKGCAHAGPASVTLIGRAGRYDLVRSGGVGDRPARRGLSLDEAIAVLREQEQA